jgi:hypothetical protein
MQVALIPPVSQLHRIVDRKFQMALPDVLKSRVYEASYQSLCQDDDKFTILDNGMFETSRLSYEGLINLAIRLGVDEIVMPDTRFDMEGTLIDVDGFLDMYIESVAADCDISLQIVVQVGSISQIPDFIWSALELEMRHFGSTNIFTFGIPRRFVERFGDQARCAVVDTIQGVCTNQIHLLGYARTVSDFNEIRYLSEAPQVRSMDTDAPFVWTAESRMLGDNTRWERQPNYFELPVDAFESNRLGANIDMLDWWARA